MPKYLTESLPGIGGGIKQVPEDFQVTEIPLYPASGDGEHTYVEVEKRGITTIEAIRRISRAVGVSDRDIGYAGMKDAVGVTVQRLSIPRVDPAVLLGLELPGLRMLSAVRHGNKLRLGHLAGNRFVITISSVNTRNVATAAAVLSALQNRGVPNFFGPQRYGAQGNYPGVGRALLLGDFKSAADRIMGDPAKVADERWSRAIACYHSGKLDECLNNLPSYCRTERDLVRRLAGKPSHEKAVLGIDPRVRKLYLSAYQSAMFDMVLDERLDSFDTLWEGDLAYKHENGACFLVEDAAAENLRAQRFEISPTGPLFGCKMKSPLKGAAELESRILHEEGLSPDRFDLSRGMRMEGERRPLRVPLEAPDCQCADDSCVVAFSLPKGAYATSVLRELMKVPTGGQGVD